MDKILTKKEKLRYVHWSIWPGIFWLISPCFYIAAFLTGLICTLTMDPLLSYFHSLLLHGVWYEKAVLYIVGVSHALLCTFVAFGGVYLVVFIYYFFFDKDIASQKHFKKYHLKRRFSM